MPNPLVSIIIPTYNRAHLIEGALNSVLLQTHENWECIIVDDGSTDKTEELMAEYINKDSRFQYHHRPKNRLPGGNGARNYGIDVAKGDYITFLDSDDYIAHFAIEEKLRFSEKIFDCVITGHTRDKNDLKNTSIVVDRLLHSKYDEEIILNFPPVYMGDVLISKSFLYDHRFDEELIRGQDHVFFVELFRKKGNYIRINGIHYLYNHTPDSITKRVTRGNKKYLRAQLEVGEKMMKEYNHNPKIVNAYKKKSRHMYKALIKRKKYTQVFHNFDHFRKAYNLSFIEFSYWILINTLTGQGFDKMKRQL